MIKRVSINQKESNELWIPAQKIFDDVPDSQVIKHCLKSAIKLYHINRAALNFGIDDIEKYFHTKPKE